MLIELVALNDLRYTCYGYGIYEFLKNPYNIIHNLDYVFQFEMCILNKVFVDIILSRKTLIAILFVLKKWSQIYFWKFNPYKVLQLLFSILNSR